MHIGLRRVVSTPPPFIKTNIKNQLIMQVEYTFIATISKTDFGITYTADREAIGIVSIKVKGIDIQAHGQLARDIKAEVLKHYEINHKQIIYLN